MISQEYLQLLDNIYEQRIIGTAETDNDLLEFITETWDEIKVEYRDHVELAKVSLYFLAGASYELLSRLTNTNWEDIISAAKDLHIRKNAGYSGGNPDPWANFRECEKFGIRAIDGVMTRLCDKYVRFNNVYRNSELDQVGESAIDTLKDLAAYSLIARVMLGERKSSVRSNHI